MKKLLNLPLTWKLLLVPAIAALSFAAYLIYSSLVLSEENTTLREIRESDFPILEAANKNLNNFDDVVDSLKSAVTTGETGFLGASKIKAFEILQRYETLIKLDKEHRVDIERQKAEFNAYFALSFDMAQQMTLKKIRPENELIAKLRQLRDAYAFDAAAYRDMAEKDFNLTISDAIAKSKNAQIMGFWIGTVMLFIIAVLTFLVTRGIVKLEKGVEEKNRQLAVINNELELEIQKLKSSEEAKSHAEAANQIKDAFLANMSHELRTPMNAIIGLSHLCMQTDMSFKQHDYITKIHCSAKSLLEILNDILDISKIEAGKMEMDKTPFALEEVMANLSTIIVSKSQEKNLEFLIKTAPDVPNLLIGDPLRLGQILINLVGNAFKFTETGVVIVTAELEKETGDQVCLRFSVKDSGIGMSQQEIERLFQPFTQADTSITRKFGGTGLGLTISRRFVEMMGGKIWVESMPGIGSKFSFTANFQKAEKQVHHHPAQSDLRGLRVLAVDDSESSRQILKSHLDSFAFDVTLASNGQDALQAARKANEEGKPFSLAIIDCKTPQTDGVELARKLRELTDLHVKPKLLLISVRHDMKMSQLIETNIVDGILEKPFQQSRLYGAIARIYGCDFSASGKFKVGAQFNHALISQIRGASLLLVEDNEINQQVAQELLESFDVSVTIAENGEEAIAQLKKEKFDGVLMDMQMPVMDGISATREIRKYPQFANLPIIALTANVMVSEQKEFIDAGMNDHISKPINPDQLVVTLAKWLHPEQECEEASRLAPTLTSTPVFKPESPPELPGINVTECIRRIGGKVTMYYLLLDKFRVGERNVVSKIREALAANDHKTAERLAHTLRGIAGTLGAETLQYHAGLLESNIKNGVEAESELAQVDRELAILIANINQAFEVRQSQT